MWQSLVEDKHYTTVCFELYTHALYPSSVSQLVLRDNDISEVPKELHACAKLVTLHLQSNQINVLPPELSELRLPCHEAITHLY